MNPKLISMAMGLVNKADASSFRLAPCSTLDEKENAIGALDAIALQDGSELALMTVTIGGKPVAVVAAGPAGTRAALGF